MESQNLFLRTGIFRTSEHRLQRGFEMVERVEDKVTGNMTMVTVQFNGPEIRESAQSSSEPFQTSGAGTVQVETQAESAPCDFRVSEVTHEDPEFLIRSALDKHGEIETDVLYRVHDAREPSQATMRIPQAVGKLILCVQDLEGFSVNQFTGAEDVDRLRSGSPRPEVEIGWAGK